MALCETAIASRLAADLFRGFTGLGHLERPARAPLFAQADRDGLFRFLRAVLAFADVMDLLADEFALLGAGGLAFSAVLPRALQDFLFGHGGSPREMMV